MRKPLLILLVFVSIAAAAGPKWTAARSEHFELYTTEGERAARDTLRHFEMVRTFFYEALKLPGSPVPVRIIGFRNREQYEEYAPHAWSAAYFHPGSERDTIVMSALGWETEATAIHEYVHLLVKQSGVQLPLWMNEGYAELYSTLRPQGSKALVGTPVASHYQVLRGAKWPALPTIWEAAGYGHSGKGGAVGMFYGLSWALMHMMNLSDEYRAKSGEWLNLVVGGTAVADAYQKVYGKTVAQVTADLENYLNRTRVNAALFDVPLKKGAEKPETGPADPFAVDLALAELLVSKDPQKAKLRLEELGKQKPDSVTVWSSLAQVAMSSKDRDEGAARQYLDKAFASGKLSARMLRNYAYLLRGEKDRGRQLVVLEQLIAVEPNDADLRMNLVAVAMQEKNYHLALSQMTKFRTVKPESAQYFFHAMAVAAHETDDVRGAVAAAKRLEALAKTPEQLRTALGLVEYVSKSKKEWAAAAADAARARPVMGYLPGLQPEVIPSGGAAEGEDAEGRPRIVRRGTVWERRAVEQVPLQTFHGRLTQMECLGQQARITIMGLDGQQRRVLLIEDPNQVVIRQAGGGAVEMTCGAQKTPKVVSVEYEEMQGLGDGVAGALRVMEMQ